jgi:hypothetical protein
MPKVVIDGVAKTIRVNESASTLDIRVDVYKEWVLWVSQSDNSKFLQAMRYTGLDPMGGALFTGDTYFLINGWKLLVDLTLTRVSGVLLSDNYDTAYYTYTLVPLFPVSVSSLVTTISTSGGGGGTAPTASEVATAVWNKPKVEITTAGSIGEWVKGLLSTLNFLGLK